MGAVIEVADSSLDYDKTVKLELYARSGIEQYVIVNLRQNEIEVCEKPLVAERRYGRFTVYRPGDIVSLRLAEKTRLELEAARILP